MQGTYASEQPTDFQAATAAAAAAAAAASAMRTTAAVAGEQREMEREDTSNDQDQWSVNECGFLDNDVQRAMRGVSAAEDITQYPIHGWVDVTKEFHDACAELLPGELAQDMLFGLFEAMSAIEIMDPKMDVGMGFDKFDLPPPSFEAAIAVSGTFVGLLVNYLNFDMPHLLPDGCNKARWSGACRTDRNL